MKTDDSALFAVLAESEQNVMVALAQQRTTTVVGLAAAVWRTTPDWQSEDLHPLLMYILDSLCSRGLVVFKLGVLWGEADKVPKDIRLTPFGWSVMGYPRYVPEVGSTQRHGQAAKHTTDGTNYLNHKYHAAGGDIIREDFPTHRANFPKHIHMYEDD